MDPETAGVLKNMAETLGALTQRVVEQNEVIGRLQGEGSGLRTITMMMARALETFAPNVSADFMRQLHSVEAEARKLNVSDDALRFLRRYREGLETLRDSS